MADNNSILETESEYIFTVRCILLAVGSHRHTRLTTSAYSILIWTTFCGMGLDY